MISAVLLGHYNDRFMMLGHVGSQKEAFDELFADR